MNVIIDTVKFIKGGTMCRLFLLDGEVIDIFTDLAIKYKLKNGIALRIDTFQELIEENTKYQARKSAFDYVSYKPRNTFQIKMKLKSCGYDDSVIDDAIKHIKELGYLDDEKFIESYINDTLKFKRYSSGKALQMLTNNGVSYDSAQRYIEKYYTEEVQLENAYADIIRKVEKLKNYSDKEKINKLRAFLQRKGYSFEIINNSIKRYFNKS